MSGERDGDAVLNVKCPKCGNETVRYSGNYFCADPDCWIMDEKDDGGINDPIIISYLRQRHQIAKTTEERDRMAFYLQTYGVDPQ